VIGHYEIALVFQSAVSVAVLGVVLLKFWSEARLDAFRQQMFAIRDELFDYAAAKKIGFDDPAYRLLRRSMNGFIRYGHQLTFFRMCATALELKLAGKSTESTWFEDWENALKKIQDEQVRVRLKEFHDLAMVCAANRLIFGSPVLLILVLCSIPVLILRMGWLNLKSILKKAPLFTVSHVIDTRMIENQAAAAAIA
jgi:hypothetical protein